MSGGYGRDDPYRYRGNDRRQDDRGYDRGYDRSYRDDRGGYERAPRDDAAYDRRDRDDSYGRFDRYGGGGSGGRGDRDRGYPRGGGPDERRAPGYDRDRGYERPAERGDGPRREPTSGGAAYGEGSSRPEGRDQYGGRD